MGKRVYTLSAQSKSCAYFKAIRMIRPHLAILLHTSRSTECNVLCLRVGKKLSYICIKWFCVTMGNLWDYLHTSRIKLNLFQVMKEPSARLVSTNAIQTHAWITVYVLTVSTVTSVGVLMGSTVHGVKIMSTNATPILARTTQDVRMATMSTSAIAKQVRVCVELSNTMNLHLCSCQMLCRPNENFNWVEKNTQVVDHFLGSGHSATPTPFPPPSIIGLVQLPPSTFPLHLF